MAVFTAPDFDTHETLVFCHDAESGLKAIIALHNTTRGPALGGCRMWPYASEAEALGDVLRLSRGMTYKSALADLPFGGGKSVIIGDPRRDKTPALLRALAREVEALGGRYRVAEDVGISVADVEIMAEETSHVAGIGSRGLGDPSPATAQGVFVGIKAAWKHLTGSEDLSGLTVAVQGAGHVGAELAKRLKAADASILVSDIDRTRAEALAYSVEGRAVPPEAIFDVPADIFAPCALGGILDDAAIERLTARVVAGSANNQLAEPRHAKALQTRGILYAPDYVINAGGVIAISYEAKPDGTPFDEVRALSHVGRIHETLLSIFEIAERQGLTTAEAADRLAEQRFRKPGAKAAA